MRTDKKLDEIIKELMDKLDDDEEFCTAEYDAVQEYCGKRKYQISDEDLHTIKAIGLENVFDRWNDDTSRCESNRRCFLSGKRK